MSKVVVSRHESNGQGSLKSYSIGFGLSLYFTITAYLVTIHHSLSRATLIGTVAALALIQFVVQCIFFLHLAHEAKPRWKRLVFAFMLLIVAIITFGSIWIMTNLNYHMLSPNDLKTYMRTHEGL